MMHPNIEDIGNACCGCSACSNVCPTTCISMADDAAGFRYPTIDDEVCVHCGKCDRVCPVLNQRARDDCHNAWWAFSKNDETLLRSSSGGVFSLLAERVLEKGGIVCGARFGETNRAVVHDFASESSRARQFLRSKYVQSYGDRDLYDALKDSLRAGTDVLFSGTACQIAGLKNSLEIDHVPQDTLILVDVICHGVPSPKLWSKWVGYVEEREDSKVVDINFRDKVTGWSAFSVSYFLANGKTRSAPATDDWYMKAFFDNASLRPSCFRCPSKRRCGSDLTLGDYWGISESHPRVDSGRGVSAVICSTKKGDAAFFKCCGELTFGESSYDLIRAGNPPLETPPIPSKKYSAFMKSVVGDSDVSEMMRRWSFDVPMFKRLKRRIAAVLRGIR